MNFADLLAKMKSIDENIQPTDKQTPMDTDTGMEECGGMPMPSSMSAPKQQDNVTMNVSMNGSGAGGIRDLMAILKNIEQAGDDSEPDIVVGTEEYANDVNTQTHDIQASIPTGDDLSGGKGKPVGPKGVTVGGSNPLEETLMQQLANLYQEVKLR